jgi:hypothetical protein
MPKTFFTMQERPYPMGETPIAKVPNLGDNITSNIEVKLVEVIIPNLKENAPKQQV